MRRPGIRDSGFGIREARLTDAAAILDLEKHFPSDRMSLRSVRHFLRSPTARVVVAPFTNPESRIPNPGLAGALILLTRKGSRTARIYSVVVSPEARGQGLAQRLVGMAERAARRDGLTAISLEVRADNAAARGLYARLGYAECASLPGYYEDGADGLRLEKALNGR